MGEKRKTTEFDLISRFFAPLAEGEPGAFGLADDAASIRIKEGRLIVTTDALVSGVHFPEQTPANLIAEKLLGVNLSDLASMGAAPRAYVLSAALPDFVDDDWLESFSKSLASVQKTHGIDLIGGDTVATPGPLTLSVCMLGEVEEGKVIKRSGASPGDQIFVSGTIGDAALGLLSLQGELERLEPAMREELEDRYHRPRPRIDLGLRLFGLASAAVDVSDGLVADLAHLCEASSVAATLQAVKTPLSSPAQAALKANPELLAAALTGGDDYELLFTAPKESAQALSRLALELELPLTVIGSIIEAAEEKGEVSVVDENGSEISLPNKGYRHFG